MVSSGDPDHHVQVSSALCLASPRQAGQPSSVKFTCVVFRQRLLGPQPLPGGPPQGLGGCTLSSVAPGPLRLRERLRASRAAAFSGGWNLACPLGVIRTVSVSWGFPGGA